MKIFQYIYKVSTCVLLSAGLFVSCSDDTLLSSDGNKVDVAASEEEFPWQPGSAFFKLKANQSITTRAASECVTRAKVFDDAKVKVEQVFDMTSEYADLKRRMGLDRWFIVRFDEKTDVNEVLKELRNDPAIEKAHGNIAAVPSKVTYTPATRAAIRPNQLYPANNGVGPFDFSDPYLQYQWHYMTTNNVYSHYEQGADINLFPAWQQETGDPNVVVAVLDSGIDFSHPDLTASAWNGGVDETTGEQIHGRNFYNVSTGEGNINTIIPG
ncbi:subtilase family N-terminal domain-containing protein, partial [Prevotella sp.]|uniref:subtilase family N-terminal domain-containing protein n=1 Tax=Prevotella sp. TaxID=59823 RepID=UPI002F952DA1